MAAEHEDEGEAGGGDGLLPVGAARQSDDVQECQRGGGPHEPPAEGFAAAGGGVNLGAFHRVAGVVAAQHGGQTGGVEGDGGGDEQQEYGCPGAPGGDGEGPDGEQEGDAKAGEDDGEDGECDHPGSVVAAIGALALLVGAASAGEESGDDAAQAGGG